MSPRLPWSAPLALLLACSDAGVTKFNSAPTAEITSHASGDTVREGDGQTLRGAVGDPNHGLDELSVSWLVDGDGVCPEAAPDATGLVTCAHAFAPTGGVVVLEVRDPDGGSGSARVELEVTPTDAPVAQIASPTEDGVYYADQLVPLEGSVTDAEDPPDALTVAWESSLDGPLAGPFTAPDSEGGLLGALSLSQGEHFLTLTVTDSTGKQGRDSATIRVGAPNSPPSCGITAPADGATARFGDELRFEATVADVDVPADWLQASWTSDVDGPLRDSTPTSAGEVVFSTSALSAATHTITFTATDEVGATCTDLVVVTVGQPPVLSVTAPTSGDTVNDGEPARFEATVSDADHPTTTLALRWESDVDGVFSTEGADAAGEIGFWTDALSPGPHLLTVRATDPDGLYDEQTLLLTVNEPPTAPVVGLGPSPATTVDTLTATAAGSVDPDGSGPVTYAYAWFEDGVRSGASTGSTFPAASTTKHRTYRVVVTPTDGTGFGPSGQAELTVVNSAPALSGPTLSAATARVGETLTCAASATDADPSDTPTLRYAWQDGSTGPTYTLTSADDPGDVLTCTVTADDGDGGVTTGSVSASVLNTAPTVSGLSLSPNPVYTNDTLTASATLADADGDALTVTYTWYVDGVLVQTGASATLDGSSATVGFDKDEIVTVSVSATDGTATTSSLSGPLIVSNSPPTAPGVTIDPPDPVEGEDLWCELTTPSADADGDPITYTMAWTADGLPHTGAATTDWPGDTVDGADPIAGEVWVCVATPDDGDDTGPTASDSVTIRPDSAFRGVYLLSERNASRTWEWEPAVSATGLTAYHSQQGNDTDCNADEGTTDYFVVEHNGDGIYRNASKIVSTPYAYPKHVAVFNGQLVVMSRNDCTVKVYTFAGTQVGSYAQGCTAGQGVATDGVHLYVSMWNGSSSSFRALSTSYTTVSSHSNPSGLSGNNIVDMAYDSDNGDWIGLVTSGEGGTSTTSSTLVRFTMGGSVTQTWSMSISMDGIGLSSCP
jgi:hypothetical protein